MSLVIVYPLDLMSSSDASSTQNKASSQEGGMNKPLAGKQILVVDDEKLLREAICFDLKRKGCIVFEAGSGKEALDIVASQPLDAVISDVRMPNGDGMFLLEEIKKLNLEKPLVLLVTGFADFTESEAMEKGALGLLEKPIDRNKMLSIITKVLTAA